MRPLAWVPLFLAFSCSESPSGLDAGAGRDAEAAAEPDAAPADASPADTGGGLDATPPDAGDPGPHHELRVPAAISACGGPRVDTTMLATTRDQKARVRFRAGSIALPEHDYDYDLIEALELGHPVERATARGPGHFSYAVEPGPVSVYTYAQAFQVGTSSYAFSLTLRFGDAQPIVLDLTALTNQTIAIQLEGLAPFGLSFVTCDYAQYGCTQQHFRFEGGGALDLNACTYCPSLFICKADPAGIMSATFTLGAEQRAVTDFFGLTLSMRHHNWGSDALISFEPPIGRISGVFLPSDPYPDYTHFSEVQYLGSDLMGVESHAVISGP